MPSAWIQENYSAYDMMTQADGEKFDVYNRFDMTFGQPERRAVRNATSRVGC